MSVFRDLFVIVFDQIWRETESFSDFDPTSLSSNEERKQKTVFLWRMNKVLTVNRGDFAHDGARNA